MGNRKILSFILTVFAVFAALAEPKPDLIAKVKAGKLKEARASWWGFDPGDATKCLQAAINSRVPRLIVDNLPNTWFVDPIRCVSNQEIVFEKGARIAAKRNSFQNRRDTLLTLSLVTNVTLRGSSTEMRMYRDEYATAPYDFTAVGRRDTIAVLGCSNVTIQGFVFDQSGGAAISIDSGPGKARPPSANIRVANCTVANSCRCGIYVAGCDTAVFENVTVRGTSGYWPQTGVSLNSEHAGHPLANVTFTNCRFTGCAGYGIDINVSGNRAPDSPPVSATFEKCTVQDCDIGFSYAGWATTRQYPRGTIDVRECTFAQTRRHGIRIKQKPLPGIRMTFANCTLDGCCAKAPALPDIHFAASRDDDLPVDGLLFSNVEIHQYAAKRNWLSHIEGNWMAADVKAVAGKVKVFAQTSKKEVTLDNQWRKATFPPHSHEETPPRVPFNPASPNLSLTDTEKGAEVPLSPLTAKGRVRFAFCAEKARAVHFKARYMPINKQRSSAPIVICPYGEDKPVAQLPLPDFHESGRGDRPLTFSVPAPGFYTMDVNPGHNGFVLTAADVATALDVGQYAQTCLGGECTLYFAPARGRPFAVFTTGGAAFDICQANGTSVLKGNGGGDWFRYRGSSWGMNDLWSVKYTKPKGGSFGDFQIDLTGTPGFLFLSNKKYWRNK